jgi:hypothetical protein
MELIVPPLQIVSLVTGFTCELGITVIVKVSEVPLQVTPLLVK